MEVFGHAYTVHIPTGSSNGWPGREDFDPSKRADKLHQEFQKGNISDCEALTAFASQTAASLNFQGENIASYFVQEFGVFVPATHLAVQAAQAVGIAIAATSDFITFDPVSGSGFQPQYVNDDGSPAVDQIHHFAAFFQLGYRVGADAGNLAAIFSDIGNPGDQFLALRAVGIGDRLRRGELTRDGVAGEISQLCKR
jgi:hypothetical protein